MSLAELFPEEDYQFHIRFKREEPGKFFQPSAAAAPLLAQRSHWLNAQPARHAALLPCGFALVEEAVDFAIRHKTVPDAICEHLRRAGDRWELLLSLGRQWEPDFLLISVEPAGMVRLVGGCVCFPSSWSLEEKMGKPIEGIHAVVPGLNQSIGPQIHNFLSKLRPGIAWLRSNWGVSASGEMNQHPAINVPRLDEASDLEQVWLRIERQALVSLPVNKGVLFGIRIEVHRLSDIRQQDSVARGLQRSLRTMPEAMANYKGLLQVRPKLISYLAA